MGQSKSLVVIIFLVLGAGFFFVKKGKQISPKNSATKAETKAGTAAGQGRKVDPLVVDESISHSSEERLEIRAKINPIEGFPSEAEKCWFIYPDEPAFNIYSENIEKIIQGSTKEGHYNHEKVKLRNGITIDYKDSSCNGTHIEMSLSPYNDERSAREIAYELLTLSRSGLFKEHAQPFFAPLESNIEGATETSVLDGEFRWNCGLGDCVVSRKNHVVSYSYTGRESIKSVQKLEERWKKRKR